MNNVKSKVIEALECAINAVKSLPEIIENNRFKILDGGWIQDKELGIDWGPSSGKSMNHEKAIKWAEDKGGRLPAVEELRTIVDYERSDPATDIEIFKDMKSSWYWTNTPVAGCSVLAWCVSFGYGIVNYNRKDNDRYVRPVRASQ